MSILFWTMTILSMPTMDSAIRCSLVCGWGHLSLAATSSSAPLMRAAPDSIVAIRVSCPGASTKDTARRNSVAAPHPGHFLCVEYAFAPSQSGHL